MEEQGTQTRAKREAGEKAACTPAGLAPCMCLRTAAGSLIYHCVPGTNLCVWGEGGPLSTRCLSEWKNKEMIFAPRVPFSLRKSKTRPGFCVEQA